MPVVGLQGVRQALLLAGLGGEARAAARWQVRLPLHRPGVQAPLQLTGALDLHKNIN